jgi:dynein heavy chain 1, cytosolic
MNPKSKMTLAFTKLKDGSIDDAPLNSQLTVMTIRCGLDSSSRDKTFLVPLQRQTRYSFAPLVRKALLSYDSSSSDPHEIENLQTLQKKIRELDLAIEQCQRSTLVPLIRLTTLDSLLEIGSRTSAMDLKRFLEKYLPSQVDAYFEEIGVLGLILIPSTEGQVIREEFANEVNKFAKQWPIEINKQTKLISSNFPSSSSKEVEFWKDFDIKLADTKRQLEDPSILLTKLVLKRTNRVSEELIREAENELERTISIVQGSCAFLRDFPIESVIGASSIAPSLTAAITDCLHHFTKIKYAKTTGGGGYGSTYDLHRACRLLDSLSSEVHLRLVNLLKERNIMKVSFEESLSIVEDCQTLFKVWENEFVIARTSLSDMEKRKGIKLRCKTVPDHQPLRQRLAEISEFRAQHEKLFNILSEILSDKDDNMILDLRESYRHFLSTSSLDVLDTTEEGQKLWSEALAAYEKRLERMEDSISRLICDQLKNSKSTDETFRLFSIFNPLFFRRSIWNAVGTYRSALVRDVHNDIERLQEKFKQRYDESLEKATADIRDIPPLSGRILWARQIENQLKVLLQRLQHVLGTGWQDQSEGKKLKEICQELLNFLNVDTMFDSWTSSVSTFLHDLGQGDTVVLLVNSNAVTGKKILTVNYDQRLVQLFKEVRHLEWLIPNTSIPYMIKKPADEAFARYPHASTLQAALSSYYQAKKTLTPNISVLVGTYDQAIKELVTDAIMGSRAVGSKQYKKRINWGGDGLDDWVDNFSRRVNRYEEKVEDAIVKGRIIEGLLNHIRTCPFERSALANTLASIQSTVDEMQMRGFSYIEAWVAEIDQTIEKIISQRLGAGIERWIRAFQDEKLVVGTEIVTEETPIVLDQTVHEILLSNQLLYLSPPLEQARAEWITSFHQFIAMACTLPRIVSSQFNVFPGSALKAVSQDYSSILQTMSVDVLRKPYLVIEEKLSAAKSYVQQWLQYQVLWDVPVSAVTDRIGREIDSWQKLLLGVKAARATIESQKDETSFGPIVINFRKVQNIINLKYDTWQKELQQHFGAIVSDGLRELHTYFVQSKRQLESIQLEGATKDVISGVEFILKLKGLIPAKKKEVLSLELSEKLLTNQRYQFPRDWLAASNTASVFGDLVQILERRVLAMDSQLSSLQSKIKEESNLLRSRVNELSVEWEKQRPIEGDNFVPADAIQVLSMFSAQSMKLKEDQQRIIGATSALGLDILDDDRVDSIMMEISELKDVWLAISPTWDRLQDIRGGEFKGISIPKLRKQLDGLLEDLNSLPLKVRSYSPFETLQGKISKYLNAQPVLRDIVSEALKDRHWRVLMTMLQLGSVVASHVDLRLGHIWDANMMANRKAINDLLQVAQGELALEQYIKDVKEYWMTVQFKIILREGNVRLITEWAELFTMLEDHLNSLASLKQSPYFRNVPEFQEDATLWENKLTSLRGIFDVWIEVQRKWVYLQGIFNNSDIKTQLPSQHTKFKGIDNEFSKLMKRAHSKPQVHEILSVDGILAQLERQDSTMTLIQKALGEYLEKQRQIFPRFYFVNNDDLVEIIGNSNEPAKIFSHLSKMFAALSSVSLSEENHQLISEMGSKEGESVTLKTKVDLSVGVKEWLCKLEIEMVATLSSILQHAMGTMAQDESGLVSWVESYPAQMVILASQVKWCEEVEQALSLTKGGQIAAVLSTLEGRLKLLSESVLHDVDIALRRKCEQLITEIVHQRDVTRQLVQNEISDKADFSWIYHLRFYWNSKEENLLRKLTIQMSNASFFYGFEYLGIADRLVQTNLTDRCYLTLTQALHLRMGGNPFGPAGTGKTESVKMLGSELGRFVLVFNCDENFDYAAMGRIFAGLCQVGAWGCFDEFNRLEERILSAVSQQILTIQRGLMARQDKIELLGVPCKLHNDVGIFVTMNPGYAGRSNLPDNLKQLFRAVAMVVPDRKMIAQVMLFSQGIISAEELAGKVVLLFTLCEEQLSPQSHYDFGLRSLKSVLTGAGDLKRHALTSSGLQGGSMEDVERDVLIRATCNSIVPKLVADDIPLFTSLLRAVFPGVNTSSVPDDVLVDTIRGICQEDSFEFDEKWIEKILQLKHVIDLRHGVMLVGPSCTGKTSAWRTLLKALGKIDGSKGDFYVIDPKSIKKDKLYGTLDPNTLEWTDGIFTKLLRKICESSNVRSGQMRRSWIIFDGDVDPEWAENLNSVLDDNKILTLPSGDRLKLTPNVRIIMEVDTLKHATLATVSRCGMVWFPENIVSREMMFQRLLNTLRRENTSTLSSGGFGSDSTIQKEILDRYLDALTPYFSVGGLVDISLNFSLSQTHVMEARSGRLLTSLHALLLRGVVSLIEYSENGGGSTLSDIHIESYSTKYLLGAILWAFGSSSSWDKRSALADVLLKHSNITLPSPTANILDYTVDISTGDWVEWASLVPHREIESHRVLATDVVVTTTDTLRHVDILKGWLASHKPLILCGPPGSGKTMTLTNVVDTMPELVLAPLNFSSGTTPELILKTFTQYCEIMDSPDGLIMLPNRQSYSEDKWLVVFCDEINLPQQDRYGTQRVIMFLRQLTEQGGFWNKDCKWVTLRRIQFIGACNPPTDAGRVTLSERFLRHAPLLLVDYPAQDSLRQIYRCFNHALLKLHPNLRGYVESLTDSMVEFYSKNQERFTPDVAPQYIYSPRELSRWVRSLYEAMEPQEAITVNEFVRLWAHEALRLFHDRLVSDEEREWCNKQLDLTASKYFPQADLESALCRPLLYSNWLSKNYQSVNKTELGDFLSARLKVFYEEELDVPLVIFDDVLEHVLRIDNVLRHPMGHLLLVGDAGVGKTVLSRFVSWMNGLSIFQIKANNRYTIENFDEDLRGLLRRVGVEGEKVCFIFDESNAMSSAFLERMNALLASGEVPGLFEGDELTHLLTACQNSVVQREGSLLSDTEDEIWRRFTKAVQRNLHVVFTMNPASTDFNNRCTTSPALFNRCVVNWFGTWGQNALAQVGHEFTSLLDTGYTTYINPPDLNDGMQVVLDSVPAATVGLHVAVVASLVGIHHSAKTQTLKTGKTTGRQHYLSPRYVGALLLSFLVVTSTQGLPRSHQKVRLSRAREANLLGGSTDSHSNRSQQTSRNSIPSHNSKVSLLSTISLTLTLRRHEMVEKEGVLHQKDEEANLKLNQMLEKQNEAEQRKTIAEELTRELNKQNEEIRVRKETVQNELSEAEPALESAKHSVQNIRKSQLDEVRALGRPPSAVQLTMEMVSIMLGEKSTDWADIRKVIRRDDFISLIVNFDPLTLSSKQVKKVQEYLGNPELDYASVDRASKACGPLYIWGQSQIHYSSILRKVKPLRDEVESLEEKSKELTHHHMEAIQQVSDLETAIGQYKAEYASAIRDTETIRSEMLIVKKKVGRAESLLSSLNEEKERWQITSNSFDVQMSTLIGDSLLAASFLTYAGIFDHVARKKLFMEWADILDSCNVPFRPDLDMIAYLSNPSDQLLWKSYGLSSDPLAVQNCIILERFYRFPLVIDPSGQAVDFFLRKYAEQKIVKTSFLDSSFLKTLASAVRFGTPLLVQDVELVDPILNPLLNKEFQKTGGRTLIRIGAEDIDYSPKFMIILTTRNPLARFAPDLCSRVTMVNFTVTPGSLESQAMAKILQAERPDVDRRRIELQRLQSEQSAKLRELEELLLNKISAVQGAILDDDSLVNTLETIKAEAGDLNREALSTAHVMDEIRAVSATYEPLASAMALVYFTLEKLSDINFLYQFGLQFFLRVLDKMLSVHSTNSSEGSDSKQRVVFLMKIFFVEISKRVLRSLKFEDKVLFVTRLSQIFSIGQKDKELTEAETDYLLRGVSPVIKDKTLLERCRNSIRDHTLSDATVHQLVSLVHLESFERLLQSMDEKEKWKEAYESETPELHLPRDWIQSSTSKERVSLLVLMVIRIIRPDRVTSALENFVSATLGDDFKWRDLAQIDLRQILETDSLSTVPIMLCSEMGQDASTRVDSLASSKGKLLLQVAMGSAEGYSEADKSIAQASKTGSWVLLRNVHLCPEWLAILEKRIHNLSPHGDFRLFLTCEIHPQIPTSLIRASDVIFVEASTGIKANLQRFLSTVDRSQIERPPVERSRLFALQAWLNAVVQERLRYAPLGWTKRYEFSEADSACAIRCIDQWVDAVGAKRSHLPPAELPWKAIRTSLSQSLYGGRIDNPFDQVVSLLLI